MPLSEREQKILQEIERDLYREDPAFARDVKRRPHIAAGTRARLGGLIFVAGFLTLIAFFVSSTNEDLAVLSLVLGVVAFAAMVAGIVLFVSSLRALAAGREQSLAQAFRRWEARMRDRYKRR